MKIISIENDAGIPIGDKRFNIYLVDNKTAEIKKNDWYIWKDNNQISQAVDFINLLNRHLKHGSVYKIICSTDESKKLPKLSEKSIKFLIDYYNKNGRMPDEVEVGTEDIGANPAHILNTAKEPGYEKWSRKYTKLNPQGEVDIIIPENTKEEYIFKILTQFSKDHKLNVNEYDIKFWMQGKSFK